MQQDQSSGNWATFSFPHPVPKMLPWQVHLPTVFRYMAPQYVDDFFERGALRIASASTFQQHPHEVLRDTNEGQAIVEGKVDNLIIMNMMKLPPCYILCGSTLHSKAKAEEFGNTTGIAIKNSVEFAGLISTKIPGFSGGRQGGCIYTEGDAVEKAPEIFQGYHDDLMKHGRISLAPQSGVYTDDLHLRKRSKYRDDYEYRMVWFSNTDLPYIDIEVPEAIPLCQRITWESHLSIPSDQQFSG